MHPNVIVRWMNTNAIAKADYGALKRVLSTDETEKAACFQHSADHESYIAAHAMKRIILGDIAGISPEMLRFRVAEGGKPICELNSSSGQVDFNISHTPGAAVFAASRGGGTVGVDIEHSHRPVPPGVAHRVLATEETTALSWAKDYGVAFYTFWTLKEAFVKATGEGLRKELRSVAFALTPPRLLYGENPTDPAEWHFKVKRIGTGHIVSVALRVLTELQPDIDGRTLSSTELLNRIRQ